MTAERVERRTQDGTLVALGAWVVYGLVYGPLYALLGEHTGITAFIPVLIAGWYCGAAAGAFAGLMSVPVTLLASRAIGITDDWLSLPVLVGAGAMVIVGYSLGRIRDLRAETLREISRREDVESTLGHERQRLSVVNEIAGKLRGDRTVEHVVSEAVATLHKHFPKVSRRPIRRWTPRDASPTWSRRVQEQSLSTTHTGNAPRAQSGSGRGIAEKGPVSSR